MSTDRAALHVTPLPTGTLCEGCGRPIRTGEARYCVAFGSYGEVLDVNIGPCVYYHLKCLDPYVIQLWLQTWESVLISLSPSLA